MTSRDFAFWLQGFFEITDSNELTQNQVKMIKNHLNLVFKHEIDNSISGNPVELQNIHNGTINQNYLNSELLRC